MTRPPAAKGVTPDNLVLETTSMPDGSLRIKVSATCTQPEHAIYLRRVVAVIEDLCSITPPKQEEIDAEWAE
jgi:hypothetical protein